MPLAQTIFDLSLRPYKNHKPWYVFNQNEKPVSLEIQPRKPVSWSEPPRIIMIYDEKQTYWLPCELTGFRFGKKLNILISEFWDPINKPNCSKILPGLFKDAGGSLLCLWRTPCQVICSICHAHNTQPPPHMPCRHNPTHTTTTSRILANVLIVPLPTLVFYHLSRSVQIRRSGGSLGWWRFSMIF